MKNKTLRNGIILVLVVNLLFLASIILCLNLGFTSWQFSVFITIFMFAYHFDIRIIIGTIFTLFVRNNINVKSKVFAVSEKEYKFLSSLGIKKWKDKIITLYKNFFTMSGKCDNAKLDYVLKNNINAEIIHWCCFFAGLFAILFGCMLSVSEWYIYVITSVLTSFFADRKSVV